MPERKFRRFTLAEYSGYLKSYANKVKFSEVHVHHTWKPTIANYRKQNDKESLILGMWRYHTATRGWADIAQHISIDPDGFIWEGRPLLSPPVSATGHNDSDSDGIHPFMFEMIGDFDLGKERLEGAQLETVLGVVALIQDVWKLSDQQIRFHREMQTGKSCPGTSIDKQWFLERVREIRQDTTKVKQEDQVAPTKEIVFPIIQETVNIHINGNPGPMGYLINGVTYAPLRPIAEQLKASIEWDPNTRTASITREGV
ncbi:MAG: N-acetylmuramoyl-L-alanine amidase [Paenibacillaceae bacterium]